MIETLNLNPTYHTIRLPTTVMALVRADTYHTSRLKDCISQTGQTRLTELQERYNEQDFEQTVISLVRQGEIALIPVGDHVHVRTE
jgi:hypothetical protein